MDQNAKNERDKKYNLWARRMPAVICLIFPFSIFLVIAFSQESVKQDEISWYVTKALAWGGAIFTALMFLLKAIIRDFSAMIVDNLFFNKLCYSHYMYRILMKKGRGISGASYNKIVKYQKEKKGIDIEENGIDNAEKNKRIKDVVYNIKNETREDNVVFEYNCFYGFYRNLFGGAIISLVLVSFSSKIFDSLISSTGISITDYLYPVLIVIMVLSFVFMYYNDRKYAIKMFNSYLTTIDNQTE